MAELMKILIHAGAGLDFEAFYHLGCYKCLPKDSLPLDASPILFAPTTVSKELLIDRREE
jgi:hypothetical protein